jgi:hypothetical protein
MFGFLAFLYIFYNMDFSNGDTLVLPPASEHGLEVDRLNEYHGSYFVQAIITSVLHYFF